MKVARLLLPLLVAAFACGTTGTEHEGDVDLPTAGVGPFRKLAADEVRHVRGRVGEGENVGRFGVVMRLRFTEIRRRDALGARQCGLSLELPVGFLELRLQCREIGLGDIDVHPRGRDFAFGALDRGALNVNPGLGDFQRGLGFPRSKGQTDIGATATQIAVLRTARSVASSEKISA